MYLFKNLVGFGVLAAPLLFHFSCHSGDLGNEKPDQVSVDLALTGWESGAGDVIKTKCANCHTAHRSGFVPANTPRVLDGIETLDFFKKPENKGFVRAMRKRVETEDQVKKMPPNFATPLSDSEKAVVVAFLKGIEDGSLFGVPPTSGDCKKTASLKLALINLKPISLTNRHGNDDNGDDHGNDDNGSDDDSNQNGSVADGGQTTAQTPNSGAAPCVPESPSNPLPPVDPIDPNTPVVPVTFEKVQPIVTATCAKSGCHTGQPGNMFALIKKEDYVAKKQLILDEILAGSMPYNRPTWKDTEDGKLVIGWLQGDMN